MALLEIALAGAMPPIDSIKPGVRAMVRYVAGSLTPEESSAIEIAIAENLSLGDMLAVTYRTIEELRRLTWRELVEFQAADPLTNQIRLEWMECASTSLMVPAGTSLSLAGLSALARSGVDGARRAIGIVGSVLEAGLAPRQSVLSAAMRLGLNVPILEGPELSHDRIRFHAEIAEDGSLTLDLDFSEADTPLDGTVWIAFEANRQWLGLGAVEVREGSANLLLPEFGKLLGLTAGTLPANIFALRLGEWPSVCQNGTLVVQAGAEPFAEIESEPILDAGSVSLDIRFLPFSPDLRRAKEIELWFGTGGNVWQLLGRWPIPESLDEPMALQCPSPKPGAIGIAFPGVLKLALRS